MDTLQTFHRVARVTMMMKGLLVAGMLMEKLFHVVIIDVAMAIFQSITMIVITTAASILFMIAAVRRSLSFVPFLLLIK